MSRAPQPHPETRDVDGRAIVLFGAGLAVLILVALGAIRLIFGASPIPLPFGAGTGLFGSGNPVLQTAPQADRAAYDAEKNAELHGFAWVDRGAGIARIPIEQAMRIIAENGVPDWGQHTVGDAADGCTDVAANVPRAPPAAGCAAPAAKVQP